MRRQVVGSGVVGRRTVGSVLGMAGVLLDLPDLLKRAGAVTSVSVVTMVVPSVAGGRSPLHAGRMMPRTTMPLRLRLRR